MVDALSMFRSPLLALTAWASMRVWVQLSSVCAGLWVSGPHAEGSAGSWGRSSGQELYARWFLRQPIDRYAGLVPYARSVCAPVMELLASVCTVLQEGPGSGVVVCGDGDLTLTRQQSRAESIETFARRTETGRSKSTVRGRDGRRAIGEKPATLYYLTRN